MNNSQAKLIFSLRRGRRKSIEECFFLFELNDFTFLQTLIPCNLSSENLKGPATMTIITMENERYKNRMTR